MPRLTFRGPGHRLVAFGQTVLRGESAEFTAAETRSLFAQPHLQLEHEPIDRPGPRGSRERWAAYAESVGVPVTNAMSRAEIVSAVDAV